MTGARSIVSQNRGLFGQATRFSGAATHTRIMNPQWTQNESDKYRTR